MAAQLTPGALAVISEQADGEGTLKPVLQVMDVRQVTNRKSPAAEERYRILLSDGVHTLQSILATTENHRIKDRQIVDGTIVQLQEFTCSTIQTRRIIIVIKLDILQSALVCSVAPRPVQIANNSPSGGGGSYTASQGMVAAPADQTVKPVYNVSYCGSYDTILGHSTINANMMQSMSQQPALNTHQNQRFAVPYGRSTEPLYQQAAPMYINRRPASKNDVTTHVVPVAELNLYLDRWTIKARVTAKTGIAHYTNRKGPGRVFSFDVLDAHGGEIRVTGFNAQLDLFYDQIVVGKVYLISGGNLKPADRRFNSLSHEYEITLDHNTFIQNCPEDNSIPRQQFNFQQISELETMDVNALVALVGVVTSVSRPVPVTLKNGSEAQKRTLQLKDISGQSVEITFWGKFCDDEGHQLQMACDSGLNPILALKNVRVKDFNGRYLSTSGSTQLKINPDFPEAENLRHRIETEGRTAACVSLSRKKSIMSRNVVRKTVAQIKDEDLGRKGKPEWITIKGSISHVQADNFIYPACTIEFNGRHCNKKVTNNGDGTWYCERCDQALPNCEYRCLLNFHIQDHTGVIFATAFHAGAMDIIGCSTHEIATIKEDKAKFAEVIQGIRFQMYLFKEDADTHPDVQASTTCSAGFSNPGQASITYCAGFSNQRRSMPTSNNACTANMGGSMHGDSSNQYGQQINTHGGLSSSVPAAWNVQNCMTFGSSGHNAENCPAAMYRQQPAARPGSSYGPSPGDAGHNAKIFPGVGPVTQPQPYRGYNRQSYARGRCCGLMKYFAYLLLFGYISCLWYGCLPVISTN